MAAAREQDVLQQTWQDLHPTLDILQRFHHRNKNQHRLSKWWAQADMLRRHLKKFLGAVDGQLQLPLQRQTQQPTKKAKPKRAVVGEVGGGCTEGEVKARAVYLRAQLVPRAYLAFSQLTADRQFAHLGLMLLGVLAQVDTALSKEPFAPGARAEEGLPELLDLHYHEGEQQQQQQTAALSVAAEDESALGDDVLGVAVSREEVDMMTMMIDPTLPTDDSSQMVVATSGDRQPRKKKKQQRENNEEQERENREEDVSIEPPKKKKKKKKADEFDDIFGSLNTHNTGPKTTSSSHSKKGEKQEEEDDSAEQAEPAKPEIPIIPGEKKKTKKKKGGGGDDFDDIFGSLSSKKEKKDKTATAAATATGTGTGTGTGTKKRKKKRADGDEFDDIFSSLT
ncbi:hypothetical protein QBC46DRAFT_374933 [Diplogelasinospora grovesii]|uniref:RNase MRP protein 1 RNA binding domain-containing protein n=1 Tax=Diplogelasinospora grovesii TaxID=303347 RepID=A0AAN6S8U2_9PEZI|nr:hypothetical protein QBC46DRAFT_374933 [Diplogelasinospora grovesii]